MPKSYYLYSYKLTHLTKSNRVRFVYLLRGRNDEKGIISILKGHFICNGCFIIPEKNNKEIIQILDKWKIKYSVRKILLID